MQVGYARVSTQDQKPELQRDALRATGCERVFEEKAPGKVPCRGVTSLQLVEMFSTMESAHDWFVEQRWGYSCNFCPRCEEARSLT